MGLKKFVRFLNVLFIATIKNYATSTLKMVYAPQQVLGVTLYHMKSRISQDPSYHKNYHVMSQAPEKCGQTIFAGHDYRATG